MEAGEYEFGDGAVVVVTLMSAIPAERLGG
jgi:hypothetical protein